jgi:regulator of replication initiation timing
VQIHERINRTAFEDVRIDKAARVVRRVKVNGNRSANKRHYADGVLARATSLYEGAKVYLDHDDGPSLPGLPEQTRTVLKQLGDLRNVTFLPGGHRADLHVLPSKAWFLEDVESHPHLFGLSHVADVDAARERTSNGEEDIVQINEIIRVDVVGDPATTRGMFEHRNDGDDDMGSDDKAVQVLETQVKERDERVKVVEQQHREAMAELSATKAALAALRTETDKLAAERDTLAQRAAKAEQTAQHAEIRKLVADAGFAAEVAEPLIDIGLDKARAVVENLKQHTPAPGSSEGGSGPRSEGRTASAGVDISEAELLAAFGG